MKITKITVGLSKKVQETKYEPVMFSISLEAEVNLGDPDIEHLKLCDVAWRLLEQQKDHYFRKQEAQRKYAEELAKNVLETGTTNDTQNEIREELHEGGD